jgi:hypothetical protein
MSEPAIAATMNTSTRGRHYPGSHQYEDSEGRQQDVRADPCRKAGAHQAAGNAQAPEDEAARSPHASDGRVGCHTKRSHANYQQRSGCRAVSRLAEQVNQSRHGQDRTPSAQGPQAEADNKAEGYCQEVHSRGSAPPAVWAQRPSSLPQKPDGAVREFVLAPLRGFSRHLHLLSLGTWPSTCSTWAPHPAHEGRPQVRHVIALHIPPRVSGGNAGRKSGGVLAGSPCVRDRPTRDTRAANIPAEVGLAEV